MFSIHVLFVADLPVQHIMLYKEYPEFECLRLRHKKREQSCGSAVLSLVAISNVPQND